MNTISTIREANKTVRIILLAILTFFYISVTFFPHSHTVNGVTIVHSHPHKKLPDKTPVPHSHSNSEFILIEFLSSILLFAGIALAGILVFKNNIRIRSVIFSERVTNLLSYLSSCRPRAPSF